MWNFHRTPWPERWGAEIERTIQRTIHFSLATHRPSLLRDRLFRDESMQRLNNFEFYRRILSRCAWAYERGSIDICSSKRIKREWYKKNVDGKKAFQNAFSEMNFTWKYTAVSDPTTGFFLYLLMFTLVEATIRYYLVECQPELYVIK